MDDLPVREPDDVTAPLKPGSRHPHEVKARALALFQEGYGVHAIETILKTEFGRGPDHATLARWRQDCDFARLIRTGSEELAVRSERLMHRDLNDLEALPHNGRTQHQILASLDTLNRTRGTAVDKLQRDPAAQTVQTNQYTINIVDRRYVESQRSSELTSPEPWLLEHKTTHPPGSYRLLPDDTAPAATELPPLEDTE